MSLRFDDLTVRIPGKGTLRVRGEVKPGECVHLRGPSGCGKTTTLKTFSGLRAPATGRVWIHDQDVHAGVLSENGMGLVFQSGALFPHLTVLENVVFGLREKRRAWDASLLAKKGTEALARAGLEGFESRSVTGLSGGERSRVSLLRTLLCEPKALLLDEPFAALDEARRRDLEAWMRTTFTEVPVPILVTGHDERTPELGQIQRRVEWNETCLEF